MATHESLTSELWGSGTSVDQLIAAAYGPESPYQRATDVKALVSTCQLMGMDVNSLDNRSMNFGGLTGLA